MTIQPRAVGVFGISGVGKSTRISQFARAHRDYFHIEASALIKSRLANPQTSSEMLRTSAPDKIIANQRLLVDAFKIVRSAHPNQVALLDAHSVIESDGKLVYLPTEIIADLGLVQIVVMIDTPENVALRRRLDTIKTRPVQTIAEIDLTQEEATRQCRRYSTELGLPLTVVNASDAGAFARALTTQ